MKTAFTLPNGSVIPLANIDKIGEVTTTEDAASFIIYMKDGRPPEEYKIEHEFFGHDMYHSEEDVENGRTKLIRQWTAFLAPPPVKKDKIISLKANGHILLSSIEMLSEVRPGPNGYCFVVSTFTGKDLLVSFPYKPGFLSEENMLLEAESKAQAEAYRAEVMADWTAYHA